MPKTPTSPTSPPGSDSDPVLAALQRSAALLENDAAALPTAAFHQRARRELLQAAAAPAPATPMQRLRGAVTQWDSMFGRRRLVGLGLGAALFGLVAVPAFAAPSAAVGRLTGAIGAAITDVPALFAGAPPAASPRASAADTDTSASTVTTTATRSTSSPAALDAALPAQGLGVIVSTIARSTGEQGEAHGDAVSAAAHSLRAAASSVTSTATAEADGQGDALSAGARNARESTSSATSTSAAHANRHGDAVSAVAHTPPPAGENHGQQVSAVARRMITTATFSSTTSTTSAPQAAHHGATVATAAHMPAPAGDNRGQQVSRVAGGGASTAAASAATTSAALPPVSLGAKGTGAGASASSGQGANGQSHGR